MLDINTRSESNLHGTWARIWASRGVREQPANNRPTNPGQRHDQPQNGRQHGHQLGRADLGVDDHCHGIQSRAADALGRAEPDELVNVCAGAAGHGGRQEDDEGGDQDGFVAEDLGEVRYQDGEAWEEGGGGGVSVKGDRRGAWPRGAYRDMRGCRTARPTGRG